MVLSASGQSDSTSALDALENLCRHYWMPIYAFVRRQGNSPHDGQDLTQEFFARLLEKQFEQLKQTLTEASRSVPYSKIAARLGTSEGAVKVAVHRLRQRYRELLRAPRWRVDGVDPTHGNFPNLCELCSWKN